MAQGTDIPDPVRRPELTLPAPEAAAYAAALAKAGTVLEFGSGGSTLLAAEAGLDVFSVESDGAWTQMMRAYLAAHPPKGKVHLLHVDIGPTKEWGHPADESKFRHWPDYAQKIWESPEFRHPDLVLIDGRFRLACFLTTAYRITRPVKVFFDDYKNRQPYHAAEDILAPTRMIGRMAEFDLTPTQLTPDRMRAYTRALLQPV